MSMRRITLSIDSDLRNVFLISTAVGKLCSLAPFSGVDVFQIELCVVESVNNAIEHAYGNKSGHQIEVIFTLYADRLTFDIRDQGQTMDANFLPQVGTRSFDFDPEDVANLPEGGMGLSIIKEIMDQVIYASTQGTNTLTLTKFFQPGPPTARRVKDV